MLQVNFYNINTYNKQNNYFLSSLSTILQDFLPEKDTSVTTIASCNLWTVYLSQQRRATTWRRVAGSHLGCDAAISLDLTFSSICLFLAKLTCASATALRGRQNRTEIGAIFGQYAQNECSVKLHRNRTVILCSFFERNYLQIPKSMI